MSRWLLPSQLGPSLLCPRTCASPGLLPSTWEAELNEVAVPVTTALPPTVALPLCALALAPSISSLASHCLLLARSMSSQSTGPEQPAVSPLAPAPGLLPSSPWRSLSRSVPSTYSSTLGAFHHTLRASSNPAMISKPTPRGLGLPVFAPVLCHSLPTLITHSHQRRQRKTGHRIAKVKLAQETPYSFPDPG